TFPSPIVSSPSLGSDGTVYVASGDGTLWAVKGGSMHWQFPLQGVTVLSSPALGNDGTIYIGNSSGTLLCIKGLSPVATPNWDSTIALSGNQISLVWQNITNAYMGYYVYR